MYKDEYALYMYKEQKQIEPIKKFESMERKTMSFDKKKLSEFKVAFEAAKKRNEHYFMFDGEEFFLGYAKYAIEHLENEFNKNNENND